MYFGCSTEGFLIQQEENSSAREHSSFREIYQVMIPAASAVIGPRMETVSVLAFLLFTVWHSFIPSYTQQKLAWGYWQHAANTELSNGLMEGVLPCMLSSCG